MVYRNGEPEKTTNAFKECKEHSKIGRDRSEKERREGRRKSKGATSSKKMRLKSKRPKQEEEGGAGVEESSSVCYHTQNGVECQRVGCPCISGGTGHCTTPTTCRTCYVYRTFHIMHAPGDMFVGPNG